MLILRSVMINALSSQRGNKVAGTDLLHEAHLALINAFSSTVAFSLVSSSILGKEQKQRLKRFKYKVEKLHPVV